MLLGGNPLSRHQRLAPTLVLAVAALFWGCSDDTTAPDDGDAAYSIQAAVDAASPGDTVFVPAGVHTATHEYTDFIGRTYRVACVMKPGVTVRGETGDPADVIIDPGGRRGFWFHETGDSTGLAAVTVRNASWAISGFDASPRIERCVLENNGDVETYPFSSGAGMYFDRCRSVITDCVLRDNEATSGGGATFSSASDVRLERCEFSGNHATQTGGGLTVANDSRATLVDCVVTGNSADEQGGGIFCHCDSLAAQGGTIATNVAGVEGGGVCFSHVGLGATLTDVVVTANRAPAAPQGHVELYSGEVRLVCCETDTTGWAGPVTVIDEGCDGRAPR